ncbi:MAG: efflux RND transporter periplasmic adaptor subunit [Roseiarcus sp.]|jgi:HlyD family secretion protein
MSKRALIIPAVLALLALGGGSWFYLHRDGVGSADQLTLYGDVDIREVQPAFNDSGPIATISVQEGAHVKCGDLLATLDDTRYAAALAQAKGQMENLKQTLDKLVTGSRPEEIAQAKATMDALQTTYMNDEATYKRYADLAATSAGTIQQRDDAKAAFESVRQQYEAARQAYLLAVEGPRAEDIAAARAAYQAAQAATALAQRQFDDTRLYAQSDGVVEDRILEPGDMASPATPVLTVALPNPLWVRAYAPENDLGRIRLGMKASVTADSYPGRAYDGWIGYISPTAEFTPKTVETPELRTALVYQLRVYVCDAHGELRLGMPATVHIDLTQAAEAPPPGCGASDAASR